MAMRSPLRSVQPRFVPLTVLVLIWSRCSCRARHLAQRYLGRGLLGRERLHEVPRWACVRDRSQIAATSRNAAAEWRCTENVEPAMSRQWTGISVSVAPSRRQVASSSTSKANPAVRSGSAAARASGPEKNLNPHWVSVESRDDPAGHGAEHGGTDPADRARPDLDDRRRSAPREPMTTGCPAASRLTAASRADRSVAMSASQNPTNGRLGGEQARPDRDALARALAAQQPDRNRRPGTAAHDVGGRVGARAVHHEDRAAQRQRRRLLARAASPPGSLRASLRAGTTISRVAGSGGSRDPRSALAVLVERGTARRAVRRTGFSTFWTTATAPTAITMPTTMAMIRRDTSALPPGSLAGTLAVYRGD